MYILALNCGSSSLKYQVFDADSKKVIVGGNVEKIGLPDSFITQKYPDGKKDKKVVEMKNGEKKISKKKNYPGYIFVLANMDEKVMMSIREASKVLSFVEGNGEKLPNAMKPKDINEVLNQLDIDSEVAPTHKNEFREGESLMITNGPFVGFTGVVKSVNYEKEELELAIMIFGRETPVDIGFKHVERTV